MALIPPFFFNTVVALGEQSSDGKMSSYATGFLYGRPAGLKDGRRQYQVFLVTNRHVFERAAARGDTMHVRFNKLHTTGTNIYKANLKDVAWTVHPDPAADVAVLWINAEKIKSDGIDFDFFAGDDHALTLEEARTNEVSAGDGIFVLGFPLGLAGDERNYVIVRQGILARVQDWISGNASTFLIDASIYPGNSGGPVLLKPEIAAIEGTKPNDSCSLIGMVSSYLAYEETAISEQTGRRRMVFEENSELATVVPHNVIQEALEEAVKKISPGSSSA